MIAELRRRGFVEIYKARVPSAVYALVKNGEVVYIGQSKSIYDRVAAHHVAMKRAGRKQSFPTNILKRPLEAAVSIDFDQVLAFFCEKDELLKLETRLINEFRPRYNKQILTPLPNVKIDVVALAREVGIEFRKPPSSGIFRRRVA